MNKVRRGSAQRPLPRITQRSLHRHRTAHRGVPGKLLAQISAPQGVEIDMIGLRRDVRGIVAVHADGAFHGKRALAEIRSCPLTRSSPSLRCRFEIKLAGELVVEREVADVHCGVDHRGSERSGRLAG